MPIGVTRNTAVDFCSANSTVWLVIAIKAGSKAFGYGRPVYDYDIVATITAFSPIRHRKAIRKDWVIT